MAYKIIKLYVEHTAVTEQTLDNLDGAVYDVFGNAAIATHTDNVVHNSGDT